MTTSILPTQEIGGGKAARWDRIRPMRALVEIVKKLIFRSSANLTKPYIRRHLAVSLRCGQNRATLSACRDCWRHHGHAYADALAEAPGGFLPYQVGFSPAGQMLTRCRPE